MQHTHKPFIFSPQNFSNLTIKASENVKEMENEANAITEAQDFVQRFRLTHCIIPRILPVIDHSVRVVFFLAKEKWNGPSLKSDFETSFLKPFDADKEEWLSRSIQDMTECIYVLNSRKQKVVLDSLLIEDERRGIAVIDFEQADQDPNVDVHQLPEFFDLIPPRFRQAALDALIKRWPVSRDELELLKKKLPTQ